MTVQNNDISVEDKLKALYNLKKVDEEIRRIEILRGELPLDIQDLEDEIEGMKTREDRFTTEIHSFENQIAQKKNDIVEAQAKIKKYEALGIKVADVKRIPKNTKGLNALTYLDDKYLKDYLGTTRFNLYKDGKASLKEMVDISRNAFIPLSELKKKLDL